MRGEEKRGRKNREKNICMRPGGHVHTLHQIGIYDSIKNNEGGEVIVEASALHLLGEAGLLLSILLALHVLEHVGEVGGSQTSYRIPTNSARESLARRAATILSTLVVTHSDIVEAGVVVSGHLVDERIQEAKRLSSLLNLSHIQQGEHSGDDGGSLRRASNRLSLAVNNDQTIVTVGSDIRESTARSVEVRRRRQSNSRCEVASNSLGLIVRLTSDVGEAAARSEVGDGIRHSLLGTTTSAL